MAHLSPGAAVWLWMVVMAAFATPAMSQAEGVPSMPKSQDYSPLADYWWQALKTQSKKDKLAPKTFLAPEYVIVDNWVPQDASNPLYEAQNLDLLVRILRDYMAAEKVNPDDPRMSQINGLQVTNLNGNTLTFSKDDSGITKVNEVRVLESRTNDDDTVSYMLENDLFDHAQAVDEAFEESMNATDTEY